MLIMAQPKFTLEETLALDEKAVDALSREGLRGHLANMDAKYNGSKDPTLGLKTYLFMMAGEGGARGQAR